MRGCAGVALLAWLTIMAPAPAAGQRAATGLGARLDAWLQPFIAAGHMSGTLLVRVAGETRHVRTVGTRTADDASPLMPDTPLNVASLAKPLTVLIATRLAAEGRLRLDDTVGAWLPGFPGGGQVTVDDLLRHRSGIPHRVLPEAAQHQRHAMAELVALAAAAPRDFEPGTAVRYSSGGYTVAAAVLERSGGASYAELLRRHVTGPVGATHTSDASTGPAPGGAWGQYLAPGGPIPAPARDLSFLVGAGAVSSTAADIARIVEGIVDGTYGEAVRERLVDSTGSLAWHGATSGHRAMALHHGPSGLTVVYLGNLHTGLANLLQRDVPRLVAGLPVTAPTVPAPPVLPVPQPARATASGWYMLGWPQPLRFVGDSLALLGEWPLWPIGPDRYFWPQDYQSLSLERDADGAPRALQWRQEDGGLRVEWLGRSRPE